MVGDFNFSVYVPNYDVQGHPRQSDKTLAQCGELLREELDGYFDQRDSRYMYFSRLREMKFNICIFRCAR